MPRNENQEYQKVLAQFIVRLRTLNQQHLEMLEKLLHESEQLREQLEKAHKLLKERGFMRAA
jgi:hypothetical protein